MLVTLDTLTFSGADGDSVRGGGGGGHHFHSVYMCYKCIIDEQLPLLACHILHSSTQCGSLHTLNLVAMLREGF